MRRIEQQYPGHHRECYNCDLYPSLCRGSFGNTCSNGHELDMSANLSKLSSTEMAEVINKKFFNDK